MSDIDDRILTQARKIMASINKKYYPSDDQRVVQMFDDVPLVSTRENIISSGSLAIDSALGIGGFPLGRIVEIFGQEGSGKTTLALHAVAEAQKKNELEGNGKMVLFIDAEHALDPTYARAIGVNPDTLLLSQPDYGEQAFEIADQFIVQGLINLFVIDSVAAMIPKAEYEGEMDQKHMGVQARLMSQSLRKISGNMSRYDTAGIFINQIREKIGVMFGNPETTPGGRALKFWASMRIATRSKKDPTEKTQRAQMTADIVKNKLAPPHKKAVVDIIFGKGFDTDKEIVDVAVLEGIVERSGSWFSYNGEKIGQGIEKVSDYLHENEDINEEIRAKVVDAISANPSVLIDDSAEDIEDNEE